VFALLGFLVLQMLDGVKESLCEDGSEVFDRIWINSED
jgi:hypothetical protein